MKRSAPTYLSSVSCPQCGIDVPSPEAMRTPFGPVWKTKHTAYHLAWQSLHTNRRPTLEERHQAVWDYAHALEDDANRARRQDRERIADLEMALEACEYDLFEATNRPPGDD